jgi:hypothetical protein
MNLLSSICVIGLLLGNVSPNNIPKEADVAAQYALDVLVTHVIDNPDVNSRIYKVFPPQMMYEAELGLPFVVYHLKCDSVFHNLDNLDFMRLGSVEEIVYPVLHNGDALFFIPMTQDFQRSRDYLYSWRYSTFIPALTHYKEWTKILNAQSQYPSDEGYGLFAIRLEKLPNGYFVLKSDSEQYVTPMDISIDEVGEYSPDEHKYYPFIEVECMIEGLKKYCLEHFGRPKGVLDY